MKKHTGRTLYSALAVLTIWTTLEKSWGGELEPLKTALISMLGKVQVQHSSSGGDFWFQKGGHSPRVVFIEKNVYPPNCSHTWAVGIDTKTGKVASVHALEMGCPHGFPAKERGFLSQFQGKSISDLKTLDSIDTIAKATGTCKLAAKAVQSSITKYQKVKGKI